MDSDEQTEILEGEGIVTSLEKMITEYFSLHSYRFYISLDTALYYNEAINIFTFSFSFSAGISGAFLRKSVGFRL